MNRGRAVATNENTKLANENTFICGASGSGKSQALKNLSFGKRRILWDPDRDHIAQTRVYTMVDFINALKDNHKKPVFSVAYSGDPTPERFELFCRAVFAVLDGNKRTEVIIEELADCVETIGKAKPAAGQLIRRARKYGGVLFAITQRPQEVPKTIFTQCGRFYIGRQQGGDVTKMAKFLGVAESGIRGLEGLQFWKMADGKEPSMVKFTFIK